MLHQVSMIEIRWHLIHLQFPRLLIPVAIINYTLDNFVPHHGVIDSPNPAINHTQTTMTKSITSN